MDAGKYWCLNSGDISSSRAAQSRAFKCVMNAWAFSSCFGFGEDMVERFQESVRSRLRVRARPTVHVGRIPFG